MEDRGVESGLELVLDNRKLIISFLVFILILGSVYVLGFIDGKRQGYHEGTQAAAVLAPNSDAEGAPLSETALNEPKSNSPGKSEASAAPEEQPLDWYKNVNRPEEEGAIETSPLKKTEESSTKTPLETSKGYSVQVGAFRKKHEAEIKAQLLKSKGFDYRIEPPQPPEQLYLLKVGKFSSRTDAIAMQLRLKNSGFKCFIKTN
jgi:cell division protein FtsN